MDLIKRSDAIQEFGEYLMHEAQQEYAGTASEDIEDWKDLAEHILKDVPSFEPKYEITADQLAKLLREGWTISEEPKQGEWIKHDEERDYCSVCKHIFKTRTLTKQDKWTTYVDDLGYNFCPNCGARMFPT